MKNIDKKDMEKVRGLLDGVDSGIVATKNGSIIWKYGRTIKSIIKYRI